MSQVDDPDGSGEIQNENMGPEDSSNPERNSNVKASIIKQISEKQREMKHKRKNLSKKHRETAELLSYLCTLDSELHRAQSHTPEVDAELEEKHRAITESALLERSKLLEQYARQNDHVNRLIGTRAEREATENPKLRSPVMDSTHNDNIQFVQPTPEREENLEEYMRKRSPRTSLPRARQGLFNGGGNEPFDELRAEIAARKRELRSLEAERDVMRRPRGEIEAERDEGLLSEVKREREKYASLLEERRLLEETQTRMSQRMASPGPPPMPSNGSQFSDMELVSLSGNAAEYQPNYQTESGQGLPEFYFPQEPKYESYHRHINPSHSLPVVLPEPTRDMYPQVEREWQQPEAAPVLRAEQSSVLHEISDKLSLLLQQRDDTQLQQRVMQTPQQVSHSSYPAHSAVTPVPFQLQQFTSYPPNTPGVEIPPQFYSTGAHQVYPLSLPAYPPPVPPSPFPSYPPGPAYFVPPAYHQPTAPYLYQSLPTPAPPQPPNQWTQTLHYPPPLPAQVAQPTTRATSLPVAASSQDMNVPLTVSCTQTDLTFLENPLSSHPVVQERQVIPSIPEAEPRRELPKIPSRREHNPFPLPPSSGSAPLLENPPQLAATPQASPLFDQVQDQIYSEVASILSENETRPYYLMELLRAVQLLKTDYLREAGVSSLKRIINNYLNQDQIDGQAFSALPSEENPVYSPTQNFPLARHYLNTDLSGSSENVGERDRCPSRSYPGTQERVGYLQEEAQSEISEVASDLSYTRTSPWEQQVRALVTRIIPFLGDHLDQQCEPKLLALIHQNILSLFSQLFPEELVRQVWERLDSELKETLSKYRSNLLRDCGEELLIDLSELFFAQMDSLDSCNSIELSNESDGGSSERDCRERARDDALAAATEGKEDETICLTDSAKNVLVIQGRQYKETASPVSPSMSPPNIIDLTLSECRPIADDVTSERSEDFSQSKTVDTISETASCTASDLSEMDAHRAYNHVHDSADRGSSPKLAQQSTPSFKEEDSDELPPFASSLHQGSFTLLNPDKEARLGLENKDRFISEVVSLESEKVGLMGDMLGILPPSSH